MSTKIYDAFRLPEGTDLFEVIASARPILEKADDLRIATSRIVQSVAVFDRRLEWTFDLNSMSPMVRVAYDAYEDAGDNSLERDKSEIGFGIDDGRLYALLLAPGDIVTAFASMPGIEDFHYQNQTDRPDGITEAEWDHRRDVWNRILPGFTSLNERMVFWTLRGDYNPRSMMMHQRKDEAAVAAFLTAFDTDEAQRELDPNHRARRWVLAQAINPLITGDNPGDIMADYFDLSQHFRADENINEFTDRALPLFPTLMLEDLWDNLIWSRDRHEDLQEELTRDITAYAAEQDIKRGC